MRREWNDTIKYRRWDEFERLAKWEPDQILCDTIAELERGFTDKPDKKALKKVLWILEKAGFKPAAIEEETVANAPQKLADVCFMMSADARGDVPITYGTESNGKFRWLTAYVHETKGITRASDDSMSLETAPERIQLLKTSQVPPYLSGEIDPAFGLWRIKRALAKNKPGTIPSAIAYWRKAIDPATEVKHPALTLKPTKTKATERAEDVLLMEPTMSWRIELGAATPILESMYEAQQSNKDTTEEEQKEAVKAAGVESRRAVLTSDLIAEHHMRLLDLAYLMNIREDERFGKILSSAQELQKLGADSEYAKGLVDKTVVIYVETMKRSDDASKVSRQ